MLTPRSLNSCTPARRDVVSADPGHAKSANCSKARLSTSTRRMYDTNDGRAMRRSTSRFVVPRVLPKPIVMVRKSSRCMLRQVTVLERAHARRVDLSPRSISATRSQMSLLSMLPEASVDYSKIVVTATQVSKVVVGGQGAQTAAQL
jgi:hypothetical protein